MKRVVVYVTCGNKEEAEQIVNILVTKKLVACGNIIYPIRSIFSWKNELCQEDEALIILKTLEKNIDDVVHVVKINHSYETPEIIALPIIAGSKEYLDWIDDETM
jgi:periplasmic divalent cation tolerance protein